MDIIMYPVDTYTGYFYKVLFRIANHMYQRINMYALTLLLLNLAY